MGVGDLKVVIRYVREIVVLCVRGEGYQGCKPTSEEDIKIGITRDIMVVILHVRETLRLSSCRFEL